MCTDPSAKVRDLSNEFTTQQLDSANEACTLAAIQVLTQEADECWIFLSNAMSSKSILTNGVFLSNAMSHMV